MKNAGSSEKISVEFISNEGSLNEIRNQTKFFTLYADDFIQTAQNYIKKGKNLNTMITLPLDRFNNFKVSFNIFALNNFQRKTSSQ